MLSIQYLDESIISYAYDAVNQLIQVTDWENRVTSYEYDAAKRLTNTTRPDGSVLTQAYDTTGNPLTMVDTAANGSLISSYTYVPLPKDKATIIYGKDW